MNLQNLKDLLEEINARLASLPVLSFLAEKGVPPLFFVIGLITLAIALVFTVQLPQTVTIKVLYGGSPVQGAKVTITIGSKTFEKITDAQGLATFTLPPKNRYVVTIEKLGFKKKTLVVKPGKPVQVLLEKAEKIVSFTLVFKNSFDGSYVTGKKVIRLSRSDGRESSVYETTEAEFTVKIPEGDWMYEVTCSGFERAVGTFNTSQRRIEVSLKPAEPDKIELIVRVVDDAQNPVSGAVVILMSASGTKIGSTISRSGIAKFKVPPGKYRIGVPASQRYGAASTEVEARSSPTEVQLILPRNPIGELKVTVTDEDGNPIEGAEVTVLKENSKVDSGKTDSSGVFVAKVYEKGIHAVVAYKKGFARAVAKVKAPGEAKITLKALPEGAEAVIKVIVESRGQRVVGAGIGLFQEGVKIEEKHSTAEGTEFYVSAGKYTVKSWYRGVEAEKAVSVKEGEIKEVRIEISLPVYKLRVKVVDAEGNPIPDLKVSIISMGEEIASGTTDSSGTITFAFPLGTSVRVVVQGEPKYISRTITMTSDREVVIVYDPSFTGFKGIGFFSEIGKIGTLEPDGNYVAVFIHRGGSGTCAGESVSLGITNIMASDDIEEVEIPVKVTGKEGDLAIVTCASGAKGDSVSAPIGAEMYCEGKICYLFFLEKNGIRYSPEEFQMDPWEEAKLYYRILAPGDKLIINYDPKLFHSVLDNNYPLSSTPRPFKGGTQGVITFIPKVGDVTLEFGFTIVQNSEVAWQYSVFITVNAGKPLKVSWSPERLVEGPEIDFNVVLMGDGNYVDGVVKLVPGDPPAIDSEIVLEGENGKYHGKVQCRKGTVLLVAEAFGYNTFETEIPCEELSYSVSPTQFSFFLSIPDNPSETQYLEVSNGSPVPIKLEGLELDSNNLEVSLETGEVPPEDYEDFDLTVTASSPGKKKVSGNLLLNIAGLQKKEKIRITADVSFSGGGEGETPGQPPETDQNQQQEQQPCKPIVKFIGEKCENDDSSIVVHVEKQPEGCKGGVSVTVQLPNGTRRTITLEENEPQKDESINCADICAQVGTCTSEYEVTLTATWDDESLPYTVTCTCPTKCLNAIKSALESAGCRCPQNQYCICNYRGGKWFEISLKDLPDSCDISKIVTDELCGWPLAEFDKDNRKLRISPLAFFNSKKIELDIDEEGTLTLQLTGLDESAVRTIPECSWRNIQGNFLELHILAPPEEIQNVPEGIHCNGLDENGWAVMQIPRTLFCEKESIDIDGVKCTGFGLRCLREFSDQDLNKCFAGGYICDKNQWAKALAFLALPYMDFLGKLKKDSSVILTAYAVYLEVSKHPEQLAAVYDGWFDMLGKNASYLGAIHDLIKKGGSEQSLEELDNAVSCDNSAQCPLGCPLNSDSWLQALFDSEQCSFDDYSITCKGWLKPAEALFHKPPTQEETTCVWNSELGYSAKIRIPEIEYRDYFSLLENLKNACCEITPVLQLPIVGAEDYDAYITVLPKEKLYWEEPTDQWIAVTKPDESKVIGDEGFSLYVKGEKHDDYLLVTICATQKSSYSGINDCNYLVRFRIYNIELLPSKDVEDCKSICSVSS